MGINEKTVLIVDDEIDVRDCLLTRLEMAGARPIGAENFGQALEVIAKENVDAVVTDIRMPGGTGIDLVNRLKKMDTANPAVFFLSGHPGISLDEAYDLGVDGMILKPFRFEDVVSAIERATTPQEALWMPAGESGQKGDTLRVTQLEIKNARVALGRGGFFLALENHALEVGNIVDFYIKAADFEIPDLTGRGVVRWVRNFEADSLIFGIGIEFLSLAEKSAADVITALRSLKTRAFIPKSCKKLG